MIYIKKYGWKLSNSRNIGKMKSEKDEAYKFQTFTVTKPGAGL